MTTSLADILHRAMEVREGGGRVAACLLVKARGSTPQHAGALMLVDDAAGMLGTIGGGCVEAEVRRRAHDMLMRGESGVMQFKLDHDYGWDDGLICGGTIEVAVGDLPDNQRLLAVLDDLSHRRHTSLTIVVQPIEHAGSDAIEFTLDLPPRPRLYIAGAGHIGAALARMMLDLDFDVTLFDDRPDLLTLAAPRGANIVVGDIGCQLRDAEIDESVYVVIVTRGHRHDERALEAVVGRGAKYVGMIGSRRKVKLIFDDLTARGVAPSDLEQVHAPIGLDIGSILVNEIALSIAAQLIRVRRGNRIRPVTCSQRQQPSTGSDARQTHAKTSG